MAEEQQYQALYRKYRPQRPTEVLGQEHVSRALTGAVRENRLAHAFLFCGPRGTGKTSTARILAKMVNCEHGPTPDPCGACDQCVWIREGAHLDVVEIDAASHGGVDDARDLRERAPTAPVMGREKVYIIDEAQRLSREAFDALLKLFEEPPPGVRFVLATTEPHKMPPTIVGRCQRFDFRRVQGEALTAHLLNVASREGMVLSPEAAESIVRESEGSVRDALSLLDQASLVGGGRVDEEALSALLGAPRGDLRYDVADAAAVGDTSGVFFQVHRLVQEGHDLRHFTAEMLTHFRNLLIARTAPGQRDVLDVPSDEYDRLASQAGKFSVAEITRVIALLLAAQTDMRWTTSPRLTLELALIRACMPEADPTPQALMARIERLERLVGVHDGSPKPAAPDAGAPLEEERGTDRHEDTPEGKAEPPPQEPARMERASAEPAGPPVDVDVLRRSWPKVSERLQAARQPVLAALLKVVTPGSLGGGVLELVFPPDWNFGVSKVAGRESELRGVLQELFGISPRIRCAVRKSALPSEPDDDEPLSEEAVLARLQAELGAQIAPEAEG